MATDFRGLFYIRIRALQKLDPDVIKIPESRSETVYVQYTLYIPVYKLRLHIPHICIPGTMTGNIVNL